MVAVLRVIAYDRPGHAYSITQFKTDLGSGGTAEAYSRGVPANPNIFVVRFATSCTLGMANSERPPLRPGTAGGAAVTGMKFGFFFRVGHSCIYQTRLQTHHAHVQ